jgi:hypothetical protein
MRGLNLRDVGIGLALGLCAAAALSTLALSDDRAASAATEADTKAAGTKEAATMDELVVRKLVVGGPGKPSVEIDADDTTAGIAILDEKKAERVIIAYGKDVGTAVTLFGDKGEKCAHLVIGRESLPADALGHATRLTLYDAAGKDRVSLSAAKERSGLYLYDAADKLRVGVALEGTELLNTLSTR